jgi:pimeloyl-ACP methyl ester carboxylesterase
MPPRSNPASPNDPSRRSGVGRLASTLLRRRQALEHQRAVLRERPRVWTAIIVITLALIAVPLWPIVRAHLQSVAVLDLVANKPVPAVLKDTIAHKVAPTELRLPLASGPVRARLYTPVDEPNAPALIVLHGVHHLGMDEPRLVAFATAMSSCGLRVLTPELPDIKDYHVGANSIATIGEAAQWFARENRNEPVGVMGLSFSGSLSLIAASNPEWRPYMRFVVAIGSEDEMSRVATYYRTGEDARPRGGDELLPPHEYGALVLEYEDLEDFVAPQDLEPIRRVLRAHLYEDPAGERAAMATLTPAQTATARQLMDTTSPATRKLLAEAEARHVQDMAGVSPHGHIAHLTTPVYLLHGEADNIIPSAETQWLAADLPTNTLKAELISPVLSHLDMDGKGPGLMDNLRLVHFFAQVLEAAEQR